MTPENNEGGGQVLNLFGPQYVSIGQVENLAYLFRGDNPQ